MQSCHSQHALDCHDRNAVKSCVVGRPKRGRRPYKPPLTSRAERQRRARALAQGGTRGQGEVELRCTLSLKTTLCLQLSSRSSSELGIELDSQTYVFR